MPPLSPESAALQMAAVPVAVMACGAFAGLRLVNAKAVGPGCWAVALGAWAVSLALLPAGLSASPVWSGLQAMMATTALLAATEGMLRFRGWPAQAGRWRLGLVVVVLSGLLGGLGDHGGWAGRALDAVQAAVAVALAVVGAHRASAADRVGLRLAAAFACLFAVAHAARAWAGGVAAVVAPPWWMLAQLLFCAGWPLALLLACYGRAHHRVRALATQDLLTALSNDRHFENRLSFFAAEAGRGGREFSLVVLTLEGVTQVNALLGRDAGDAMLRDLARRLRRAVRHDDLVARTGGYEFAAIHFGATDPATLQTTVDRLLASVQGPLAWRGHALEMRCRVGAATWGEAQGRLEDLRALVDRRLRAVAPLSDAGPWVKPAPTPPRPPGTRSRASDQG